MTDPRGTAEAPPGAIHRLSPEVVARIAAGEVIERPTSVAKELIENSLDAGAKRITVEVEGGVERLLRVSDDGWGMSADSLPLALERHATSKIASAADLDRLTTLGFRGEGLASVAAVSRLTLLSASGDGAGARLEVEGGVQLEAGAAGRARGTTVEVRDIFFNTPARRKFQRAASTELQHLARTLQAFALIRPEVHFVYRLDGREVLNLPPAAAMAERMSAIYGRERAGRLLAVSSRDRLVVIEGFLGAPEDSRLRADQQTFFINGRWVQSPLLRGVVKQAYGDLIPSARHPFAVLAVVVDPARVDVNVHPTKREVRFSNERDLYPALVNALRPAVAAHAPVWRPGGRPPAAEGGAGAPAAAPFDLFDSPFAPLSRDAFDRPVEASSFAELPAVEAPPAEPLSAERPAGPPAEADSRGGRPRIYPLSAFRTLYTGEGVARDAPAVAGPGVTHTADLWQLHRTYILASIRGGLLVIDQHAAHERVLYEETLLKLQAGRGTGQQLLFPKVLDLTPEEFQTLLDLVPTMEKIGFQIEAFGGTSVKVECIPAGLARWREGGLLHDLIAYYSELAAGGAGPSIEERVARAYACRSAVKAGEALNVLEMNELVDRLFATTLPQGDPHGRPTFLRLPIEDFHRRFGRSG